MKYYYPDYFDDFRCVGGKECPDSCCIVWQITVDKKTMKKYKTVTGNLGKRMAEKINPKTGQIAQHGAERRCEFLNEDNLCDIICELGEDYLCHTCATHPRHEEAYENVRERSLAITCPIACKELLLREEPVKILIKETSETESDRYFDRKLYAQILPVRDTMLKITQNRTLPIKERMTLLLGLCHDIEKRIHTRNARKKQTLFSKWNPSFPEFTKQEEREIASFVVEYQKADALLKMKDHISEEANHEKIILESDSNGICAVLTDMIFTLGTMEQLKPSWLPYLQSILNIRREMTEEEYQKEMSEYQKSENEVQLEQLLFYFIYVYVCGAVYDSQLLAKCKMAVANTLLIRELWFMKWLENGHTISIDEQVEIAHWYVREVENSDENMEQWDSLMQRNPRFSLKKIFMVL